MKIIGISGSLRKGSFNTALLREMSRLVPDGVELRVETVHGIPLYDGDAEDATGVPLVVEKLKQAFAEADGLILATPEYNSSIPGVFKNAIDWMSLPPARTQIAFWNKPVGLIGATPGVFGTNLSQSAWLPVLHSLGTRPWFGGRIQFPRAGQSIDAAGTVTDEALRDQLRLYIKGFTDFIRATSGK